MKPARYSIFLVALCAGLSVFAAADSSKAKAKVPKEEIPSEDPVIPRLHCLGLIDGRTNIFRCACPVIDIAEAADGGGATDRVRAQAKARLQHLYSLGVRTLVSFEKQEAPQGGGTSDAERLAVVLERDAAAEVGMTYRAFPMSNKGKDSFEDMSDAAVRQWADTVSDYIVARSASGGVAFHCKAGHDRTGLVAAYMRMKYQHWTADEAVAEMRRDGHNWTKFAGPGKTSSWLEDHLRGIGKTLAAESPQPPDA